jgi:hypothetical protein
MKHDILVMLQLLENHSSNDIEAIKILQEARKEIEYLRAIKYIAETVIYSSNSPATAIKLINLKVAVDNYHTYRINYTD